ncbi:uncharacterized protein UTRI_06476_B [Ustilago trichophora]|uniref:Uncharacterized protein n=1 Tax=Ustilago trichophora TaxID=86804 RepID=A0A5C3EP42_9BASI|nr:uncharacterized protein UTRI_06476_B [Ustilago trichophora]
MSASIAKATSSMRVFARGIASSARLHAEAASTPASTARPRTNASERSASQTGTKASDRLRTAQRNPSPSSPQQQQRSKKHGQNSGGNRGERRTKRLPSVLDASSTVKNTSRGQQKNLAAPLPVTDWNSALYSKPGFERLLASAPRASSIFTPNLTASPTPVAAAKGKSKPTSNVKLNLPTIKTAVSALKLHIRPGARNILGPLNNPIFIAGGSLTSSNRVVTHGKGSLAAELKAARIAMQDEKVGGSYERFQRESVLKAVGVGENKALQDAAQALAVNADLAPEAKNFVVKAIADRLSA